MVSSNENEYHLFISPKSYLILIHSHSVAIEIYIRDQSLPVMIAESSLPIEKLTALADEIYDKLVAYHGLRLYIISICAQGSLPRTWKNGKKLINNIVCKKYFEYGRLQVLHVKTCVLETVFNIPMGEDMVAGIWGPSKLGLILRGELIFGIFNRGFKYKVQRYQLIICLFLF